MTTHADQKLPESRWGRTAEESEIRRQGRAAFLLGTLFGALSGFLAGYILAATIKYLIQGG